MAGGFSPVDRQAVVALVAVEGACALFLLFGNRLPQAALPGSAACLPRPANAHLHWIHARTASVGLLTDPNAPIACEVVGTGVRGVLKFRFGAEPGLYLTAVPLTDTVKVGERIVTSATSLLFPAGIPVGRVTQVGRE